MTATPRALARLVAEIRACRICADILEPNPVLQVSHTARLLIASQAPGLRVHQTGLTFNDASGDRLRDWMGVDRATFYDVRRVSITGMAFCFPGYDENGSDLPPPKICAQHWRTRLMDALPSQQVTLLVGSYAQTWHLGDRVKSNMTETVKAWREYRPRFIPLPHPSWRNNGWLKKNPWFEAELVPYLRRSVRRALSF
ncbi:MAG: uracil-DNA glycosylase family protein [Proteobacteria bacterium]|nr:uracil-DNA glycosylase family protein [Pseudomonadota bacterium]